ncbi:MAG: hypothetical protein HXY38_04015 [Chloroflexi bacterium]|nr:hypothetical protein [Chloroflexota bacterium]
MQKRSPIARFLVAFWLLASQVAGGILMAAPLVVLLAFRVPGATDPNPGMFNLLFGLGYVMPVIFVGLGIAAWVMFARRNDAVAGWMGLATLIPGGVMLLGMNLIVP